LPVPGAKGEYEWQGFLSRKDLPQVHNPAGHYVATANHNILPPGYKHEIAYEWAASYRFDRIKQRLDEPKKFNIADCQSIQHENTSLPGQALVRLIKHLDVQDAELRPSAELLAAWDGELSTDSRAGVLYGVWLQELLDGFYRPHVPVRQLDFVKSHSGVPVMLAALEKSDAVWFGDKPKEARDQLLRTTFRRAVSKAKELLPGDDKERTWGRLHTTTFRHPLAQLGPAYAQAFNLGPVARPGDGYTPNAASHTAKFEHITGASYRHVFDLADWDKGVATSTPGQSGQPGSPHYGDLLPLWQKGEYFPLAYSRKKVEEVARERLELKPRAK
jgi:penicillin amidase